MLYSTVRMSDGSFHKVARLILGAGGFGTGVSRDDAFKMMDMYWEAGGNALDTARVYGAWAPGGDGASERTVGEWVRSRGVEKEVFVITKGAHPPLGDMMHSRLSREDIFFDVEKSMEALGLNRIDLYYLHRDEAARPVADIMESLHEAQKKFPITAIGASNWHVSRIQEANAYAAKAGVSPFTASELRWSYVDFPKGVGDPTLVTMDETERAGYLEMDLAVMAYTSQGTGLFLRGYAPDLSDVSPKHADMATPENVCRYQALLERCRREKITPSRVVIRHVTDDAQLNAFALVSGSKLSQIQDSLDAVKE